MATATARALGGLLHDLTNEELLALTISDHRPALKAFLAALIAKMWHPVSYDQSMGLTALIERAVGPRNLDSINHYIIPERFSLKGKGVWAVKCRVEAYLDGETSEEAAKRLTTAGHILGNTGDLAGFLHDHPDEVAKWQGWVLAISEDSRWADSDGVVCVPDASVYGTRRSFSLGGFRRRLSPRCGVLVLSE